MANRLRRAAVIAAALVIIPVAVSSAAELPSASAHAVHAGHVGHVGHVGQAVGAAAGRGPADDFTSFFATGYDGWQGSGWQACGPITWSVDVSELTAAQASRETRRIAGAFQQWSAASGLTFGYDGQLPVAYQEAGYLMRPADGTAPRARHIYIAFRRQGESSLLAGRTVGLGWPTGVANGQITGGAAIFRTELAADASRPQTAMSLYLHELGHVLGLGHASTRGNVMYPVVGDVTSLGQGDLTGIRAFTQHCPA